MKNIKKALISVMTFMGCACFALGVGFSTSTVKADTSKQLAGVEVSSFRMDYGASIRFKSGDPDYKKGIRFTASLADKAYADLQALEGDVTYGIVIVPKDIIASKGELNAASVFGVGGSAVYCVNDSTTCGCDKQHIANVSYTTMADEDAKDGVKNLRGSLVDIKDSNLTREMVGMGYIGYNGAYVFAENAFDKQGNNESAENNTRSMSYVAQLAIEDGKDDGSNTLYQSYVQKLESNQYVYTVNHYLPDGDGNYGTPVVEKAGGVINTTVEAKHIFQSGVENAASYAAYRTYEIDTTKSNPTGTLYANGKTVLNVYYKPMDTSLNGTLVNNPDYFLMGANKNVEGTTVTWLDTTEGVLTGEAKTDVIKVATTKADSYNAGHLYFTMKDSEFEKAKVNDWAYIKIRMYIEADESLNQITLRSWEKDVVKNVPLRQWTDIIVPLSNLNQTKTVVVGNGTDTTKDAFYAYNHFGRYGVNSGASELLCTWDININKGLTTTDVTYYIDDISWGIDAEAPEITVSGVSEELFEGATFDINEPTVTITDNLTRQEVLDTYATKKLYKVIGDGREEVSLSDGVAELSIGEYVYVVTADDRIYSDVVGNVATKEVPFNVVEISPSLNKAITEKYLIAAQTNNENITGVTTNYHEPNTVLEGETLVNGAVEINTTAANQYAAGKFALALDESQFNTVYEKNWTYIKMRMFIRADSSLTKISLRSWETFIAENVELNKWVDVIIPLAKFNNNKDKTSRNWVKDSTTVETQANFLAELKNKFGTSTSKGEFLWTWDINTGKGLTTTDVTYYISDISWGKDTIAPTIEVGDVASEMFEGTFTEPTVTVSDNIALNGCLDVITKKLYKVEGDGRTEVTLTDGKADLTVGEYVYVVTADDRVYSDVAGNIATKEVEFSVIDKIVVNFDSEASANWVVANTGKNNVVTPTSTYISDVSDISGIDNALGVTGSAVSFTSGAESTNVSYGCWFKLKLDEVTLSKLTNATAATIRMAITLDKPREGECYNLVDNGTGSNCGPNIARATWVDVTLTKDDLKKTFISYFDGTNDGFYLGYASMQVGAVATYYFNSITFTFA